MTIDERFAMPRDGHELTCMSVTDGVYWCLRCGAVWLEARHGIRRATWEAPDQGGRSRSTSEAPPCLPSTAAGTENPAGDARLMLRALTHGWRCQPVRLSEPTSAEAWRWSHDGLLGGEAWSVPGAWADGPVIDESVRGLLLTTGT